MKNVAQDEGARRLFIFLYLFYLFIYFFLCWIVWNVNFSCFVGALFFFFLSRNLRCFIFYFRSTVAVTNHGVEWRIRFSYF